MNFFETLNYSSANEDGLTELKALDISKNDRIGCITGSGDRVLHMLIASPSHVYAFDINPIQNYLLELKMAAMKELDYHKFCCFLGLNTMHEQQREQIYYNLQRQLSSEASKWFSNNLGLIKKGIIYQGRWERYFSFSSKIMRFWRARKIARLFSCNDMISQQRFVKQQWDTFWWRLFLRISFNRFMFKYLLGDPGFFSNISTEVTPWRYINDKINSFLFSYPASSSFMLSLIFFGLFTSPDNFPPYLNENHYYTIRVNLNRITIKTQGITEFLNSREGRSCNKFSLSDISSFLSETDFRCLLEQLKSIGNNRFCLRDFLTQRTVDEADRGIHYHRELSKKLEREDRSIGYTFIIGTTIERRCDDAALIS